MDPTRDYPSISRKPRYHIDLFGILIAVVLLIAYGSLYPWEFTARHLAASPLYVLLHSWGANVYDRRFLFDMAVNVAVYIPLGMSAYLAFRRFKSVALEFLAPVALGALLSASMEMLQLFTPHRQCSAIDLVNNTLGSGVGMLAGFAFAEIVDLPATGLAFRFRDRRAVALLFCWVASLLFPLFPVYYRSAWIAKLSAFLHAPPVDLIPILLCAAEWFAVGRLLVAAGARRPFRWLAALLLLAPVQFAIVNHNPIPADLEGATLGACLFGFFGRGPGRDRLAGIALLAAVALRGVAPFHFADPAQAFSWTPFIGLLQAQWQDSIPILTGKLFQYGVAIWLLARGGLGLARATVLVTVVLAAIEALQTRIPGHVAEINDPLLAILLCLAMYALRERRSIAA
jgi:VanZ family protein